MVALLFLVCFIRKNTASRYLLHFFFQPEFINVCFWYVPKNMRDMARGTERDEKLDKVRLSSIQVYTKCWIHGVHNHSFAKCATHNPMQSPVIVHPCDCNNMRCVILATWCEHCYIWCNVLGKKQYWHTGKKQYKHVSRPTYMETVNWKQHQDEIPG